MTLHATTITRRALHSIGDGDSIQVRCRDTRHLESCCNTAYQAQGIEGCRFSCSRNGLELTVTRFDL